MSANLHDKDFHAWAIQQANLLKAGKLNEIDLDNLIEEIESMGASERNQLQNRLKVLIGHLLKWQFQPSFRTRSWNATIKEQRLSVIGLVEDNPSLKSILAERIAKAYPQGVYLAVKETNLDEKTFPLACPYSMEQLFDTGFFPGDS
ncbi:MAG: DUF29 domain-containing protein [Proteobacteria bacterium]|nr:DUF29 domain-containing protein [Pseudomonadota bacterium]